MTHSNPNGIIYITKTVLFNTKRNYIKEISILDIAKPIKMISLKMPFQPMQIKTKYASKPESIRFIGNFIEDLQLVLN